MRNRRYALPAPQVLLLSTAAQPANRVKPHTVVQAAPPASLSFSPHLGGAKGSHFQPHHNLMHHPKLPDQRPQQHRPRILELVLLRASGQAGRYGKERHVNDK